MRYVGDVGVSEGMKFEDYLYEDNGNRIEIEGRKNSLKCVI